MSRASIIVNPLSIPETLSEDDVSRAQRPKPVGNAQNLDPSQVDGDLIRKYAALDRCTQRGGSARSDDWSLVQVPTQPSIDIRSEERRVGKECRSRWSP